MALALGLSAPFALQEVQKLQEGEIVEQVMPGAALLFSGEPAKKQSEVGQRMETAELLLILDDVGFLRNIAKLEAKSALFGKLLFAVLYNFKFGLRVSHLHCSDHSQFQ